jgi:glycosyltransferase involved in cell wall biosynthesis
MESQAADPRPSATEPGLLTVLMPVYNEIASLGTILERVLSSPVRKEVLVVDDGSTDGTTRYLREHVDGRLPGVRVHYVAANAGKGAAIRAGIPHVRGEYTVIQDGDLEYDPTDYSRLVEVLRAGAADVVYGTRFARGYPPMRTANRWINKLLAWMVRVLYAAPITDEATCYKAFRTDVLRSIPLTCRRFEFCPEVTAKALRRGYRIVEVPITYSARTHQEGKKIRWTDGVVAIWTLLKYRLIA